MQAKILAGIYILATLFSSTALAQKNGTRIWRIKKVDVVQPEDKTFDYALFSCYMTVDRSGEKTRGLLDTFWEITDSTGSKYFVTADLTCDSGVKCVWFTFRFPSKALRPKVTGYSLRITPEGETSPTDEDNVKCESRDDIVNRNKASVEILRGKGVGYAPVPCKTVMLCHPK